MQYFGSLAAFDLEPRLCWTDNPILILSRSVLVFNCLVLVHCVNCILCHLSLIYLIPFYLKSFLPLFLLIKGINKVSYCLNKWTMLNYWQLSPLSAHPCSISSLVEPKRALLRHPLSETPHYIRSVTYSDFIVAHPHSSTGHTQRVHLVEVAGVVAGHCHHFSCSIPWAPPLSSYLCLNHLLPSFSPLLFLTLSLHGQ